MHTPKKTEQGKGYRLKIAANQLYTLFNEVQSVLQDANAETTLSVQIRIGNTLSDAAVRLDSGSLPLLSDFLQLAFEHHRTAIERVALEV